MLSNQPSPRQPVEALTGSGEAPARPAWRPTWPRAGLGRVPGVVLLVVLGLAGAALGVDSPVRAQLAPLACLIPQLSVQSCSGPVLVAAQPVSVSRDGRTVTVTQLLSANGMTSLTVEISPQPDGGFCLLGPPRVPVPCGSAAPMYIGNAVSVPVPPPVTAKPIPLQVALQDASGKSYPQLQRAGALIGGSRFSAGPGSPRIEVIREGFVPLDPGARSVNVQLSAPDPIGSWSVSVPVALLSTSGQTSPAVTHQGVTVGATLSADPAHTFVHLTASSQAADRQVHEISGDFGPGQRLTLQDDQGRSYAELPASEEGPPLAGCFGSAGVPNLVCPSDDASFPPLPPETRSATVTVPFVTVVESGGTATLRIPIAGRQPGDEFSLDDDVQLGPCHLRVTGARLRAIGGHPVVTLQYDLEDCQNGRKLLGAASLTVEGIGGGQGGSESLDRTAQVSFGLPDGVDEPVVTFHGALVAIKGPWKLQLPVSPAGSQPAGR